MSTCEKKRITHDEIYYIRVRECQAFYLSLDKTLQYE